MEPKQSEGKAALGEGKAWQKSVSEGQAKLSAGKERCFAEKASGTNSEQKLRTA